MCIRDRLMAYNFNQGPSFKLYYPKGMIMRTNITDQIVSLPASILRSGVKENTTLESEKNIIRLNLFLAFGLGVSIINLLLSVANELLFSGSVNLAGTVALISAYYMNKDGKYYLSLIHIS